MTFPAEMRVDYVRVWQRKGLQHGVGCDPPSKPSLTCDKKNLGSCAHIIPIERPTADYINKLVNTQQLKRGFFFFTDILPFVQAHGRLFKYAFAYTMTNQPF